MVSIVPLLPLLLSPPGASAVRGNPGGVVSYSGWRREPRCPCAADDALAVCSNLATDLWMQGDMDTAMVCMNYALTQLTGSSDARDATLKNLKLLYGIRLRTDSMRFYHGYNAKTDWIFPPLGQSKGLKDRSIRLYKNALPDEFCDFLLHIFERDTHLQYPGNILGKGVQPGKKDMEIDMSDPKTGDWADAEWFLAQMTTKYLNLYEMERSNRNLANTGPLGDEGYRMKRYKNVTEAEEVEFHTWHSDGGSADSCFRAIAIVFYLNDVEEGGDTVFLTEGINIRPSKGSALIWPTGYTYVHAGLPPVSGPKYIITNFLRYTASRIFNTLDVPVPEALRSESGAQLPSSSAPPRAGAAAGTGAGRGSGQPNSRRANSGYNIGKSEMEKTENGQDSVGTKRRTGRRRRRRRRRSRVGKAECPPGEETCEL